MDYIDPLERFLTSSIVAPAAARIVSEYHVEAPILSSMITTIYVLGFLSQNQFGPLFLSPLSELYGRRPILNFANAFFTLCHIGCALAPNIGVFLAFRILSGIGGSVTLSVGGEWWQICSISTSVVWPMHLLQRGRYSDQYWGPLLAA
ncbi:major facilitator superfamily domain-containing protein [Penicillium atrosanguineum]|nr:major facilitator superfamily domain-containing protein [Penicillium atrosanguineum]